MESGRKCMAKKNRSIKVYGQSGANYKTVPTIVLKGQWLKELGFEIGDPVCVACEDGKLIITQDAGRRNMAEAEAAFMEQSLKAAHLQFLQDRDVICEQYVAEREVRYGA
jgi:antitoxin component of MazEF toxin-antitoxin module